MVQSYSPGGSNVSSHEGTLAPSGEYDWTCAFFAHLTPYPKPRIDRLSRFAQLTAESAYTLQWFVRFSFKIAPSHGGIWPTRVLNPTDNSIASAVFAGLTSVTDWLTDKQTDRPRYSVGKNGPHVRT